MSASYFPPIFPAFWLTSRDTNMTACRLISINVLISCWFIPFDAETFMFLED